MDTVLKIHYFSACKAKRMIAEKTLKITFATLEQACNYWDTAYPFPFAFYQKEEKEPCLSLEGHTRPIVHHQKSV